MTTRKAVEASVRIGASPSIVWRMLVDPKRTAQWMAGIRVESTWAPGATIAFRGPDPALDYAGTIRAITPERLLSYDLWSPVFGVPDVDTMAEHIAYFWGVALPVIARLVV